MKTLLLAAVLAIAASPLLASADLKINAESSAAVVKAGFQYTFFFDVHNAGPDTATKVVVTPSSSIPVSCSCGLADIPAGQIRSIGVTMTMPATAGPVTINASVSSSTADPDLSDNSTSLTLTVSTDPDVILSFSAPQPEDLALPFALQIFVRNSSMSAAHDVDVTVDFRPDVSAKSLPAGCSSPAAGRIVCHLDTVGAQMSTALPAFEATLVAPESYGSGTIVFNGSVTERESDFNPGTNLFTLTTKLYDTTYVTTTSDDGKGSLRQAILDANANCRSTVPCAIAFRIAELSATPWKTIRVNSPLPPLLGPGIRVDGATQTGFFGDTNDQGPEIEISGGGTIDGDGLVVTSCAGEIANLTINGFQRNGLSVIGATAAGCSPFNGSNLHDLFIGTDPTGSLARPNARGIGLSVPNGTSIYSLGTGTGIQRCVISGNIHSGIFGLSGGLYVSNCRVGVKAHSDEPLPNGASGIFVGTGGYGSDISGHTPDSGNVIAFNGETGVAVARGVGDVSVRNNRIWGNALLGIDIALDGPTPNPGGTTIAVPVLTLAHYDPISGKTIIEGDTQVSSFPSPVIHLYANDTGDPSGYGEGQRPLGSVAISTPPHFRFEAPGNLTGQFISATTTRFIYLGFAKPEGIEEGPVLSQTSEFSRWIEVR